eukprot:14711392-Ditylum_brightwellii.AAC.1
MSFYDMTGFVHHDHFLGAEGSRLTKRYVDFYTYFECNGLSPEDYKALAKLSDVPAEHINEVMCRHDKVASFVSHGHTHVSKHADPGGGITAMLYGGTALF